MILIALAIVFTQLSLLAFGGGPAIFAMAQAAPGPNMMIVPLVGWHVAGPAGLLVTSFAKFGPSSVITVFALKFWNQFKDHPLRERFEKALKPITVGLVLVSAWIIADASAQNSLLIAILAIATVMSLFKKVHPLWVMLFGAIAGASFL